ncbi:MAG: hypothetical protein ACI89L_002122 [Phycisphaerales bacterium]|jgi:hypothetical protein
MPPVHQVTASPQVAVQGRLQHDANHPPHLIGSDLIEQHGPQLGRPPREG